MAQPRPPVWYRPATNEDPCGGHLNENNGCQITFARGQPGGGLCFMCLKLQDPALNKDEIRVRSSPMCVLDELIDVSPG